MLSYLARLSSVENKFNDLYRLLNLYKISKFNNGWIGTEAEYSNIVLSDFKEYLDTSGYSQLPASITASLFDIPAMSVGYDTIGKYGAGIPSDIGFTRNIKDTNCHATLYTVTANSSIRGFASNTATSTVGGFVDYSLFNGVLNITLNGSSSSIENVHPDSRFWVNTQKFNIIPVTGSSHMHMLYAFVSVDIDNGGVVLYVTPNFVNWNTHQIIPGNVAPDEWIVLTGNTTTKYDVTTENAQIIQGFLKKYFRILPNNNYVIMYPVDMYRGIDKYTMVKMYSPWSRKSLMSIKDPYNTTKEFQNKATNGFSCYLTENGEIVLYYNARTETPMILYNGKIMGTYSSELYPNYNMEIVNVPKVAKFYNKPISQIAGCQFITSGANVDCSISLLESKNSSLTNADIPAAFVNITFGDVAKEIFGDGMDNVKLLVNNSIDMMDNIDIDFNNYISSTFIDGKSFRTGEGSLLNNGVYNSNVLKLGIAGTYRDNVRYRATVFGNTLYSNAVKLTNNPSLGEVY